MVNITESADGRRVFYIDVGDMPVDDIKKYINDVIEKLKNTKNSY